jgi:hypothetical protein
LDWRFLCNLLLHAGCDGHPLTASKLSLTKKMGGRMGRGTGVEKTLLNRMEPSINVKTSEVLSNLIPAINA